MDAAIQICGILVAQANRECAYAVSSHVVDQFNLEREGLMGVTNKQSGTRVDEVAKGIYRISTPVSEVPGGFSFNQYLLTDDQPLLFHTGPRRLRALVQEAVSHVMDVKDLRFIGFSHYESDECGSLPSS
jgi:flavorubredoxin